MSDLDWRDDEVVEDEWQQDDAQIAGRLLGAAIREPTVMRELIEAGAVPDDFVSVPLRESFIVMRDDFVVHGRCSETALLDQLEIVLPAASAARIVVDFCMKRGGVRKLDDVGHLLQKMRDRVGRRRLRALASSTTKAVASDTPLVDLVARHRRELEAISASSTTKKDGWTAADLAVMGSELAEGRLTYKRVTTSLPEIDNALKGGVRERSSCLVIAGTGTGKTTYGLHIATGAAAAGHGVLYVCLEDPEQSAATLTQLVAGHRFPIHANAPASVWSEVMAAVGRISSWPSFKMLTEQPLTAEALIAKIRHRKRTHPVDLVVVDYVQRIRKSTRFGGVTDVEHISETLRMGFAEEKVAGVLLSQVSAAGRARLAEKNAGPLTAEDSAGGVQFANDAAAVLTIERPRENKDPRKANVSTVSLRKNRDFGDAAESWMKWDRQTTRLTPCAKDGDPVVTLPAEDYQPTLFDGSEDDPSAEVFQFPGGRQ